MIRVNADCPPKHGHGSFGAGPRLCTRAAAERSIRTPGRAAPDSAVGSAGDSWRSLIRSNCFAAFTRTSFESRGPFRELIVTMELVGQEVEDAGLGDAHVAEDLDLGLASVILPCM